MGGENDAVSLAEIGQLELCKWTERLLTGIVDTSNRANSPSTVSMKKALRDWLVDGVELLSMTVERALSETMADMLRVADGLQKGSKHFNGFAKDGGFDAFIIAYSKRPKDSRRNTRVGGGIIWEAITKDLAVGVEGAKTFGAAADALKNCAEKMLPLVLSVTSMLSKLVEPSPEDLLRGMVTRMHGSITECIESLDIMERMKGLKGCIDNEVEMLPTEEWMKLIDGEVSSLKQAFEQASIKLTTIFAAFRIEEDLLIKHSQNIEGVGETFIQKYVDKVKSFLPKLSAVVIAALQLVNDFQIKLDESSSSSEAMFVHERVKFLFEIFLNAEIPSCDFYLSVSNTFLNPMDDKSDDGACHDNELPTRKLAEVMDQLVSLKDRLYEKTKKGMLSCKEEKSVSVMITVALSHANIIQEALKNVNQQSSTIIEQLSTVLVQPVNETMASIQELAKEISTTTNPQVIGPSVAAARDSGTNSLINEGIFALVKSAVEAMTTFDRMVDDLNSTTGDSISVINSLKHWRANISEVGEDRDELFANAISEWSISSSVKTAISDFRDSTMQELETMAFAAAADVTVYAAADVQSKPLTHFRVMLLHSTRCV